jgi:hypothetical protein
LPGKPDAPLIPLDSVHHTFGKYCELSPTPIPCRAPMQRVPAQGGKRGGLERAPRSRAKLTCSSCFPLALVHAFHALKFLLSASLCWRSFNSLARSGWQHLEGRGISPKRGAPTCDHANSTASKRRRAMPAAPATSPPVSASTMATKVLSSRSIGVGIAC